MRPDTHPWKRVVLWGAQPTATYVVDRHGHHRVRTTPYRYFVDLIEADGTEICMADSESRIEALAAALELAVDFEVPVVDRTRPKQQVILSGVGAMGVTVSLRPASQNPTPTICETTPCKPPRLRSDDLLS